MHSSNRIHERRFVWSRHDAVKVRLERGQALGVRSLFVHARVVVVADLLIDSAPIRIIGGCFIQNVAFRHQVALIQFDKAYPLGLVSRNFCLLQPIAASVLIEIDARIGSLIDVIEAESDRRLSSGSRLAETKSDEREANE